MGFHVRMRGNVWSLNRWPTGWQIIIKLYKLHVCIQDIRGRHNTSRYRWSVSVDWR